MTVLLIVGAALLLVLLHQVTKFLVIAWRRAGHCAHDNVVRYWYRQHHWRMWCRRCARYIAQGRDPKHGPYPKVAGNRAA